MLNRWGSFVYRRRRLVVALSGLAFIVAIVAMIAAGGSLSSGGFNNPHSESSKVTDQLVSTFGRGRSQMVFIFDAGKGGFGCPWPNVAAQRRGAGQA